jgi:hypothetical protein
MMETFGSRTISPIMLEKQGDPLVGDITRIGIIYTLLRVFDPVRRQSRSTVFPDE